MTDPEIYKKRIKREKLAREEAEKLLEEKTRDLYVYKTQLELILESIEDAIASLNLDGFFTYINKSTSDILAKPKDELINTKFIDNIFVYEKHLLLDISDILKKVINTKQPKNMLKNVKLKNHLGDQYDTEINILPIINHNNDVIGTVVRIHDLETIIKLEKSLVKEDKMQSLNILSAGVAHEIRNPLGSIMQSGQTISRRLDPKIYANIKVADELGIEMDKIHNYAVKRNIEQFIQGIRESGNRASSIINNLLQLTEQVSLIKQPNNFINLIESVISTKDDIDFKNISLLKNFANDLPLIQCNAMETTQVIYNVLKNSVDALHNINRDPEIKLDLCIEDDELIFTVKDNGIGMDVLTQNRVFEPFFTTKQAGSGVGLGLTVAYNTIVNKHYGNIEIMSIQDIETIVTISIPINHEA